LNRIGGRRFREFGLTAVEERFCPLRFSVLFCRRQEIHLISFRFTQYKDVDKIGQGFWIHKGADAAHNNQRVSRVRLLFSGASLQLEQL